MQTALTHGSLFSGIGGFDLGFQRAGIKTVWQVEINAYCRKVLAKHFPDAERFTDVKEVGRGNLKPVDIISGGFPCQDISNAGKRAGIDGERSGLWIEMYRVIRELRPRIAVVENVTALLNRGIERILGDLATCGFNAEWDCIPACALGAPHRRDRIFIVAYSDRWRREEFRTGELCGLERRRFTFGSKPPADVADTSSERLQIPESQELQRQRRRQERRAITQCPAWEFEPNVGRVANGIPSRVDRLKAIGNAVVPQIAEWIGKRIIEGVSTTFLSDQDQVQNDRFLRH